MSITSDRSRRRVQIFAFAIAAFFGAIAIASWLSGRENPRAGSRVVAQGGPALKITHVPITYHAEFRVENRAGGKLVLTTEKTWFRRPFESRIETYRGNGQGEQLASVRQSTFGVLANRSTSGQPLYIAAPPSLAGGDLRIDAALPEALRSRTIIRREQREVYGRRCQVYRAGGPVIAGDIERYVAGRGDFADLCVDRNGIVIEEAWERDGRLVRRRVAQKVEIDPQISPDRFAIEAPASPDPNRGIVERIPRGKSLRERLWTFRHKPRGFDRLGRYAVVLPQGAIPQLGGGPAQLPPVSTTDVYVRDEDLLVIDQDPSLASFARQENRTTRKLDLEGFKDAVLIVDGRMSEIRGETTDGSFLRLFGTLRPSELIRLARDLRRQR